MAAFENHAGTDLEGCYLAATEHVDVLLQRYEHEEYYPDGRTDFPRSFKLFGTSALATIRPTPPATPKFIRAPPPQQKPRRQRGAVPQQQRRQRGTPILSTAANTAIVNPFPAEATATAT
jgi:hypothetical protein